MADIWKTFLVVCVCFVCYAIGRSNGYEVGYQLGTDHGISVQQLEMIHLGVLDVRSTKPAAETDRFEVR